MPALAKGYKGNQDKAFSQESATAGRLEKAIHKKRNLLHPLSLCMKSGGGKLHP